MDPVVQIFLSVVVILPASLLVLRRGWLCLRFGKGILTLPQRLGLLVLNAFKGKNIAAKRKEKIIVQQKRKYVGYGEFVGGILFLLIAIICFIEAIQRL